MTRSITRRRWLALALAACAAVPLLASARTQDEGPTDAGLLEKLRYPKTIVLVRHAEKGADDPRDPSLDDAGVARARALARTLEGAGVTQLFASEYKRTQQTLEPLAMKSGLEVRVVSARDPRATVSAIRELPRGSVAVVAGHSNTIPGLVGLLSDSEREDLAESEHDRLYVVTMWGDRRKASVLELRYGE